MTTSQDIKPRTLILGTSYVGEGAQGYGAKLVTLWARLAQHLNPDTDILIVDSASPTPPRDFLEPYGFQRWTGRENRKYSIYEFADNIGHLNTTRRDGWGRALCRGIEIAIEHEYDFIAYKDVDIVFTRPVAPIVDRLARHGIAAACPMDPIYQFLENGLMFLDVAYLRKSRFVERYDWPNRGNEPLTPGSIPEVIFERLIGDELFILPLRGLRNDLDRVTVNNLAHAFPYGIDYLTHCKDFSIYERLLQMKGIAL